MIMVNVMNDSLSYMNRSLVSRRLLVRLRWQTTDKLTLPSRTMIGSSSGLVHGRC